MLMQTTQAPIAALYARLSRDDELQGESKLRRESKTHPRNLLPRSWHRELYVFRGNVNTRFNTI